MSKEFIEKKVEQMRILLRELAELLNRPFEAFEDDPIIIRAAERDFQLLVDLASDINAHILIERDRSTPDTYRQSFSDLVHEGILPKELAHPLIASAQVRNILVHEYDLEEDHKLFYESVKKFLPAYQEYLAALQKYIS